MKKFSVKTRDKVIKNLRSTPNLVAMFFAQADRKKNKPFLWHIKNGKYESLSWAEVASSIRGLAEGLKKLGVKKNDRVVILSENRPEWLIADMAIMLAGGISVPVYTTNTPANNQHILKDCDAHFAVCSTQPLTSKMMKAAIDSFWNLKIVCMDMPEIHQSGVVELYDWKETIEEGNRIIYEKNAVDLSPSRDDLACLIYTSGTGGAPKGVMLSHFNLLTNISQGMEVIRDLGALFDKERFFSILPLSHAYEHTCGQFLAISLGAQIYYLSGMDKLLPEIVAARPSVMIAVPRLYEVIRMRMYQSIRRKGKKAEDLFNKTIELGLKKYKGEKLSLKERLLDVILGLLIRRKIKNGFGGNIKAFVAGGAPLSADVGEFLIALGLPLLQGYGQTESSPLISCNSPSNCDFGTVGEPLLDVELKIALDGEILIRGDMVMKGYWNNKEATDNAIDEGGWLHTGDIGEIDAHGRLKITDRKKDIIVNSGGDNISPLRVESIMTLEPEIAQCMVYGDKQPHLVALVVPNVDFIATFAKKHNTCTSLAELRFNDDFIAELYAIVEKANVHLSVIEKVRKIIVPPEGFTVENEMMTPTLKVRRNQIKKAFEPDLLALYGKKGAPSNVLSAQK